MKNNLKTASLLIIATIFFSNVLVAGIPVLDMPSVLKLIGDLKEILTQYNKEIILYKDILTVKDDYLHNMRDIVYEAESLFNAITYFPKTNPGQYENNPFFYDIFKKDTWGDLYHKDGRLENKFPQLSNFDYITKNPLYKKEHFKNYADEVIKINEEKNWEKENRLELDKLIRECQIEQNNLLNKFEHIIVPSFGNDDPDPKKRVVNVTALYYAIGKIKIEVLKQKLELLLLEKESLEDYLKDEVNKVKAQILYYRYNKIN